MPLPDYPAYLPLPLKFVRTNQTGQTIVRTERLKGVARNRRWTNAPTVLVDAEWIMTNEEAQLFIVWHKTIISDAADWFSIQTFYSGDLAARKTRFTGIYSGPDPISPTHVKITAQLEIFERPIIDSDWLILPGFWVAQGRSIFDLAMNREWPSE